MYVAFPSMQAGSISNKVENRGLFPEHEHTFSRDARSSAGTVNV